MEDKKIAQEIKKIYPCENCPNLGRHVHYNGDIKHISDETPYLEVMTFNGMGTFILTD